jgi:ABC-2 type transport system ATP-binding protein
MASDHAIVCEGLRKRYAGTAALDGFDLAVAGGVVYGLLGPNGAGKTTAVRVLATLLRPDGGRAEVAGYDVVRQAKQVRARIGLVGQQVAVDEILSGRQNLELFGRLYHLSAAAARRRANALLDTFGLATRQLFGNPGAGGESWIAQHAVLMAILWPVLITAVFLPLAVRGYRHLSR